MSFGSATVGAFDRAVAGGTQVALSAYVLSKEHPLVAALEAAAAHGAHVDVVLDGAPCGAGRVGDAGIAHTNAATVAELRAHGVDARLADGAYAQHLKAAVVDGRAYLDDRNWVASDSLITTDDAADVRCVASAIEGRPVATADLAMTKDDALAREAQLIAFAPGDRIDCASESFGSSAVSVALAKRAAHGDRVRLVVSSRALQGASQNERRALARLLAAGVEVSASSKADKVCVVGTSAWVGSANATFSPPPPMLDWGLVTSEPALVARAAATFAADLESAKPIDARRLADAAGERAIVPG